MRVKKVLLGENMNFSVIVFRARTETLSFANLLGSYRVPFQIINTPRNLNVSCGISVKFPSAQRHIVQEILSKRAFSSFVGIFPL